MNRRLQTRLQEGLAAQKARDFGSAEAIYREVLAESAGNLDTLLLLGTLLAQADREDEAVGYLRQVVERDPRNVDALVWLGAVVSYLNRHEEALDCARRASELRPRDYGIWLNLATAQFGLERFEASIKSFQRAINLDPGRPEAYYGIASSYLRLGEPFLARAALRNAFTQAPSDDGLLKLGEVSLACEDPDEAISCARQVLKRRPDMAEALVLLTRAYRNAQRETDEDAALAKLMATSPDLPIARTLSGRRLQSLGDFPAAEAEFRRSVEAQPSQGVAYYGITAGRRMKEEDRPLVEQMESVIQKGGMIPDETAHLHFALGKSYDNLGDYGAAMRHFDEGNRLMRSLRMGTRAFDRAEASRHIDQIIGLFTKEFLQREGREGHYSPTPIFIAGIMRSGTTLAEQIISCHPDVGGGGEQAFWRPAELECVDYAGHRVRSEKIAAKAEEFSERLAKIAPGKPFVTDKNPANRLVYGLMHLAYPDARIVHMKRNPVDVAISIYTTLIRTGAPFVGDKEDIVFALREHERLVTHWKSVLPADRFLEVVYEDLVGDRERVTRGVLDFLGLEWSESTLHPEDNLRTVVTPSFWQVRQPVYTGSLQRWKKYEPWLGPFAQLMD